MTGITLVFFLLLFLLAGAVAGWHIGRINQRLTDIIYISEFDGQYYIENKCLHTATRTNDRALALELLLDEIKKIQQREMSYAESELSKWKTHEVTKYE